MNSPSNLNPIHALYHLSSEQSAICKDMLTIKAEDATRCLLYTDLLIKKTGPRLAGTAASHQAARVLFKEMKKFGDHSFLEEFSVHPNSFLSFMPVMATSYIISSILMLLGSFWIYLGVLGYLFGGLYAILQFVFYEKTFDPLYRKLKAYNTGTTIEPSGEVRQQVILSGHHDSAFIFNYLEHNPQFYSIRIMIGLIIFSAAVIFALYWAIFRMITGINPVFVNIIRFGLIGGSLGIIQYYFFKNRKGSPGAGDNLISSVMAMKIAKKFALAKHLGVNPLAHTRLIVLSTDAEECGLRGAAAYVKSHEKELKSVPTFVLNMDSIYNLSDLQILTSDINGTVKLSSEMVAEVHTMIEDLGYEAKLFPITFGGGGTDAAEFAKIGIDSISLLALPTEFIRENIVYHTSTDTTDKIEPQAVEAVLKILTEYVLRKDEQVF